MTENTKNNGAKNAEMTTDANVVSLEKATATAENVSESNEGVYVHKFRNPFDYAGVIYKELTFDFERLTGNDMVSIETEMQSRNEYALTPEISRNFQSKMASKAAKIGSDVLEAMPLVDFNKITNAARDFLLNTGY